MTEPTEIVARQMPTSAGKPGFLPTVAAALATFAVLFEFLAFQLSSGNDPALGSAALGRFDQEGDRGSPAGDQPQGHQDQGRPPAAQTRRCDR